MAGSFCETVLRSVGKYQTVKFAEIRSLRLGLLHYGLLFIIFVYIVVVQVREDTTNNSALLHTYTTLAFTFSSSSTPSSCHAPALLSATGGPAARVH